MGYKSGTAKIGRLLTFKANATSYAVIVTESVNGLALIVDAEGRWVASMPRDRMDDKDQIIYYLTHAGRSAMDATNVAEAITADRDYLFSQS